MDLSQVRNSSCVFQVLVAKRALGHISELALQLGSVVANRVVTVKLRPVGRTNPGQNLAEVTSEVVQLAQDHLRGTRAILLLTKVLVVGSEEIYRVVAYDSFALCKGQHLVGKLGIVFAALTFPTIWRLTPLAFIAAFVASWIGALLRGVGLLVLDNDSNWLLATSCPTHQTILALPLLAHVWSFLTCVTHTTRVGIA